VANGQGTVTAGNITQAAGAPFIGPKIGALATLSFHGQCRLVLSGANLLLRPFNGNKLMVGGVFSTIPSAGVSLAPTGLQPPVTGSSFSITGNVVTYNTATAHGLVVGGTATISNSVVPFAGGVKVGNVIVLSTPSGTQFTFALTAANQASTSDTGATVAPVYYIYATQSAGSVNALTADQRVHMTDPVTGVECLNTTPQGTATADNTKTLVGMARVVAGPAFADSTTQRFVMSWFNRAGKSAVSSTATNTSTSSLTLVELNTASRVEFLSWADETAVMKVIGSAASNTVGDGFAVGVGFDGPNAGTGLQGIASVANTMIGVSSFAEFLVVEGYHYETPLGEAVTGGTATINVAAFVSTRG
jgi:hypothetical protein